MFNVGTVSAPGRDFQVEGTGILQQVTTPLELDGSQMLVGHTWPGNDKIEARRGKWEPQGMELTVDELAQLISFSGPMAAAWPHVIQRQWQNKVNLTTWMGDPPNTWKCVKADFVLKDNRPYPAIWNWTFSFMALRNGWSVRAVFIDDTTGEPPEGLVAGVGIRYFQQYLALDFRSLFPI